MSRAGGFPPQGFWGGAISISSGPAFPPAPNVGDCFYRTDLHEFFIWNGTNWVSWDVQPPSYVVWTDGVTIWAKNGLTGDIDFYGADAATVIQAAINALPGGVGKVFIKAGTYTINTAIVVPNHVVLEGESMFETTLLAGAALARLIDLRASDYTTLKNIRLNGDNIATIAVDMTRGVQAYTNHMLYHVAIIRFTNGIDMSFTDGNYLEDVQVDDISGRGLNWASGADWGVHRCVHCTFHGDFNAIDTFAGNPELHLVNCSFGTIMVRGSSKVFVVNGFSEGDYWSNFNGDSVNAELEVHGGHYMNRNAGGNANIRGTWGTVRIFGGSWETEPAAIANIVLGAITNLSVKGKPYLDRDNRFENSGIATIPNLAAVVVVAHGLATTPNNIQLTGTHTEVDRLFVTAVGAANFTINAGAGAVTADRDVYWYAEYELPG